LTITDASATDGLCLTAVKITKVKVWPAGYRQNSAGTRLALVLVQPKKDQPNYGDTLLAR